MVTHKFKGRADEVSPSRRSPDTAPNRRSPDTALNNVPSNSTFGEAPSTGVAPVPKQPSADVVLDDATINSILAISRNFAAKFKFGYYESDDIVQEAFMLGMEGIENFDPSYGVKLETFLTHHIYKRLCNFKRNNYYRLDEDGSTDNYKESKRSLINKSPDNTTAKILESYYEVDYQNKLDSSSIYQIINDNFPTEHRTLWLRYLGGAMLGIRQSEVLYGVVSSILERHGIEHELHQLSFTDKEK